MCCNGGRKWEETGRRDGKKKSEEGEKEVIERQIKKEKEGSQRGRAKTWCYLVQFPNMLSQDVCIRAQRRTLDDTACYVPLNEWVIFRHSALISLHSWQVVGSEKGKEHVLLTFNVLWRRIQARTLLQFLRGQSRLIHCIIKIKWSV